MTATALQTLLHNLQVGTAVNVDLKTHMGTPGSTFTIVGTSNAWNNVNLLPPGLSMSSAGIITGTPTTIGSTVVKVRAALGARNPDASWTARSTGAAIYTKQRFDTSSTIDLQLATGRIAGATFDATRKRSGAGSLKQTGNSNNGDCGYYHSARIQQEMTGTSGGGFLDGHGFAPGEEFYLQFALYTERNFVQFPWATLPGNTGGQGPGKIAIVDGIPWQPNLNFGPTSNPWENVLTNGFGGLWGYTNGPAGKAWNIDVGGRPGVDHVNAQGHDVAQPSIQDTSRVLNGDNPGLASGGGTTWSTAQQERARNGFLKEIYETLGSLDGKPDPLTGAAAFAADAWHTILMRVKLPVAPMSQDGNNDYYFLTTGGIIQVWMAQDGQDYRLLFSENPHWLKVEIGHQAGPDYFWRTSVGNDIPDGTSGGHELKTTTFQGIKFTTLLFGIDVSSAPPVRQWIDEIIVSSANIPAPDFDGTGTYRTADALVTFKVAAASAFTTSFPAVENPISQGGIWVNGQANGVNWRNVQTTVGKAFAANIVSDSVYDDDIAHLSAAYRTFTPNQYVQATVFLTPGYTPPVNHEIELLVRFAITSGNARGYEIGFGRPSNSCFIMRWNGALNDFVPPTSGGGAISIPALVDGDVIRVEMVGSTITVKRNTVTILSATDATFSSGQPGMGFFPRTGSTLGAFGWKNFEAGNL